MNGKCQAFACPEKARYSLYHTIGNLKIWVRVCAYHERIIAHENLMLNHTAKRQSLPLRNPLPKKREE